MYTAELYVNGYRKVAPVCTTHKELLDEAYQKYLEDNSFIRAHDVGQYFNHHFFKVASGQPVVRFTPATMLECNTCKLDKLYKSFPPKGTPASQAAAEIQLIRPKLPVMVIESYNDGIDMGYVSDKDPRSRGYTGHRRYITYVSHNPFPAGKFWVIRSEGGLVTEVCVSIHTHVSVPLRTMDNSLAMIDQKMAELISACWSQGFDTLFSCEGGTRTTWKGETVTQSAMIVFPPNVGERFVEFTKLGVEPTDGPGWPSHKSWDNQLRFSRSDYGWASSLEFPQEMIPELLERVRNG